ncbi:MAG: DUF262 domain-containing protein [Bacteroidales bacterium]|nr:DUF262 domain-containing protein [Bacteroidales bacterium]
MNDNELIFDDQLNIESEEESSEEDYSEDFQIDEYELTSSPNDFNIMTINSFIESGAIIIPGFQRNFVWDIKRASKLIESIILGLPVPQIFLYEEAKNKFLVMDGQQRLMTIFYFIKQKFPKRERRTELREIFSKNGNIPDEILFDEEYFTTFKLSLSKTKERHKNKFNGLTYKTLGEYRTQFELRPIRNVIVKQNVPKDDNSSVFEIFNRLNSGGINLTPQEIRGSLYHSKFYDLLYKLNLEPVWRKLLRTEAPDLHMRDVELLLRGFAMMIDGDNYFSSLAKFLNDFSNKMKKITPDKIIFYESYFKSFLEHCSELPEETFINKKTKRFNTFLFEAILFATSIDKINNNQLYSGKIDLSKIKLMESDSEFNEFSIAGTTNKSSVVKRLEIAKKYFI